MRPDVVFVSAYPPPGQTHAGRSGVAAYTANLARSLAAHGTNVTVVAPEANDAPGNYEEAGVIVRSTPDLGHNGLVSAITEALRLDAPVVHLQHEVFLFGGITSIPWMPVALTAMRRSDSAAVVTLHQVIDPRRITPQFLRMHRLRAPTSLTRRVVASVQRGIPGWADATIVHEESFARIVPDSLVVPHGVEDRPTPDRTEARKLLGVSDESLTVLCFGFVAPYKGLESALRAAAQAPDVRLVIAGGAHPRHRPSYASRLRNRWGRVADFTGYVPEVEVPLWHAAADVALFCHPSPHSSSGALAVALSHGTPILAGTPLARCMGLPEEVTVPIDPDPLANRLQELASHRGMVQDLGTHTPKIASGRSWTDVARRHLELYHEVGVSGVKPDVIRSPALH